MVGGPLFLAHPELVARLGADSAAVDAPGAVRQASDLMKIRYAADENGKKMSCLQAGGWIELNVLEAG